MERRSFLRHAALGAGVVVLGRAEAAPRAKQEEEVPPTEDLMREHGVLRRLLLVYREVIRRLDAHEKLAADPIAHAATIIRAFIEDYHERDEEEYLFPRLRKANQLTGLVDVLLAQHQAGRRLTAEVQSLATGRALANAADRQRLAAAMHEFVRMYEPHAAREDTVLFPAFAALLDEGERKKLQEVFEKKEKALPLGDFEKMVADVASIEQELGLYDLAQFTPRV